MYCYHHLSTSHPQALEEGLKTGHRVSLLLLAYRNILSSLAFKIITKLLRHHIPTTTSLYRPGTPKVGAALDAQLDLLITLICRLVGIAPLITCILVNRIFQALVKLESWERVQVMYAHVFWSSSQLIPNKKPREMLSETETGSWGKCAGWLVFEKLDCGASIVVPVWLRCPGIHF